MKRALPEEGLGLSDLCGDLGELLQGFAVEQAKVAQGAQGVALTTRLIGGALPTLSLSSLSSRVQEGARARGTYELPHRELVGAMDALVSWAQGSLDLFRPSLLRATYALLLHVFLELVVRGGEECVGAARELLGRHGAAFSALAPPQGAVSTELRALALVTDPESQLFSGVPRTRLARLRVLLGLGEGGEGIGAPTAVLGALQGALEGGREAQGRPDALAKGAPRVPEPKNATLTRQLGRIEEGLGAAKRGGVARALRSAPHAASGGGGGAGAGAGAGAAAGSVSGSGGLGGVGAASSSGSGSGWRIEGGVLSRLADPTNRHTLHMTALAMEMLVIYLARGGPGGAYLLSLLNDRVRVEVLEREEGGFKAYPLFTPPVEDVAMGILRTASRYIKIMGGDEKRRAAMTVMDALDTSFRWGNPFVPPSGVFIGEFFGEGWVGVPYPDAVYTSTPFGRALLATLATNTSAAGGAAAATSITTTTSSASTTTSSSSSSTAPATVSTPVRDSSSTPSPSTFSLRQALITHATPHLRCMAGSVPGVASLHGVERVVAGGFGDGALLVWLTLDLGTLNLHSTHCGHGAVTAVTVSNCGSWALSGHMGGAVALWNLQGHCKDARAHFAKECKGAGVKETTASSASSSSSSASASASAPLPPQPSAPPKALFLSRDFRPMAAYTSLQRSGSPIWGVAFNPLCPSIFAAGGRDGCAYIWSSGVGEPQRVCCGHAGEVTCLAWHGNGVYLLTGSSDGCVRVWEASSGDCVRVLLGVQRGGGSGVTALAVAPGGRHLASGDESGAVTLWDLPLGECVQCWAPPTPHSPLHALSFTRDGRGVVAGSSSSSGSSGEGGGVALWDVSKAVREWEGRKRRGEGAGMHPSNTSSLIAVIKLTHPTVFALVPLPAHNEFLLCGSS